MLDGWSLNLTPAAAWAEPVASGTVIQSAHILELRSALTPALTALGVTPAYTDPGLAAGTIISAAHVQELREYTR